FEDAFGAAAIPVETSPANQRIEYDFTGAATPVLVSITSVITSFPPTQNSRHDYANEFYLDTAASVPQISFPRDTENLRTLSKTATVISPEDLDEWDGIVFYVPQLGLTRVVSGQGGEPAVKRVYVPEEACEHAPAPVFTRDSQKDTVSLKFQEGSQAVMVPVFFYSTSQQPSSGADSVAKTLFASEIVVENASLVASNPSSVTDANAWKSQLCDDGDKGISFKQAINYSTNSLSIQATAVQAARILGIRTLPLAREEPTSFEYDLSSSTVATQVLVRIRKGSLVDLSAYKYLRHYLERGTPTVQAGGTKIEVSNLAEWMQAANQQNYFEKYDEELPDLSGITHSLGGRGGAGGLLSNYSHARSSEQKTFSIQVTPPLKQKLAQYNGLYYLTGTATSGVQTQQYGAALSEIVPTRYTVFNGSGVLQQLIALQASEEVPSSRIVRGYNFTLFAFTQLTEGRQFARADVISPMGEKTEFDYVSNKLEISDAAHGNYFIHFTKDSRMAFILSRVPQNVVQPPSGYPPLPNWPASYFALTAVDLCERSQISGAPAAPPACAGVAPTAPPAPVEGALAQVECTVENRLPVNGGIIWTITPRLSSDQVDLVSFTVWKQSGGQRVVSTGPDTKTLPQISPAGTNYHEYEDVGTHFRVRQAREYIVTLKKNNAVAREVQCRPDPAALAYAATDTSGPGGQNGYAAQTQAAQGAAALASVKTVGSFTCQVTLGPNHCTGGIPQMQVSGSISSVPNGFTWMAVKADDQVIWRGTLQQAPPITPSLSAACTLPSQAQIFVCDRDATLQQDETPNCLIGTCTILQPPAVSTEEAQPTTLHGKVYFHFGNQNSYYAATGGHIAFELPSQTLATVYSDGSFAANVLPPNNCPAPCKKQVCADASSVVRNAGSQHLVADFGERACSAEVVDFSSHDITVDLNIQRSEAASPQTALGLNTIEINNHFTIELEGTTDECESGTVVFTYDSNSPDHGQVTSGQVSIGVNGIARAVFQNVPDVDSGGEVTMFATGECYTDYSHAYHFQKSKSVILIGAPLLQWTVQPSEQETVQATLSGFVQLGLMPVNVRQGLSSVNALEHYYGLTPGQPRFYRTDTAITASKHAPTALTFRVQGNPAQAKDDVCQNPLWDLLASDDVEFSYSTSKLLAAGANDVPIIGACSANPVVRLAVDVEGTLRWSKAGTSGAYATGDPVVVQFLAQDNTEITRKEVHAANNQGRFNAEFKLAPQQFTQIRKIKLTATLRQVQPDDTSSTTVSVSQPMRSFAVGTQTIQVQHAPGNVEARPISFSLFTGVESCTSDPDAYSTVTVVCFDTPPFGSYEGDQFRIELGSVPPQRIGANCEARVENNKYASFEIPFHLSTKAGQSSQNLGDYSVETGEKCP
ncbi:MAG: hypothetical protein AB1626_04640, partial [Candidatus Micrarchaeota archaeon]